jgi:hypothetical protein
LKLDLISTSDYLELIDKSKYNFAIKYAHIFTHPEDTLQMGDFVCKPFGLIKDLQHDLQSGLTLEQKIEYAILCCSASRLQMLAMQIDDFCRATSYMIDAIEGINHIESEALKHEPTPDELRAGLDRFAPLGVYMQIRQLTGNDVTKNEAVRSLPYNHCFNELYARKQVSDYQDAMNDIIKSRMPKGH